MAIDISREVFIPLGQAGADAFDDTTRWVDDNNRRFSDRLWLAKEHDRQQIDNILRDAVVRGRDPIQVARDLEDYLTPENQLNRNPETGRLSRVAKRDAAGAVMRDAQGRVILDQPKGVLTRTPRGGAGNYAARRLARTEMTRAFGQATLQAAALNPFVDGLKWSLSGRHDESDICNDNAGRSSRGMDRGEYRLSEVPRYPGHPNCRCVLSPVTVKDIDAVIEQLRVESTGGSNGGQVDIANYNRSEVDALRSALNGTGAQDLYGERLAPEWRYGGDTGRYTTDEAAALGDYKASWYGQLNKYLRAGDYASSGVTAPIERLNGLRDNIDAAFLKADPLTEPIRVSRGSFVDFIGIEDQVPGTVFVDDGFISTSVKEEGAGFGRALQMEIYVPKGQKVLAMDPLERGKTTGEAEVLLRRGTRFLIREVRPEEGKLIVEVLP